VNGRPPRKEEGWALKLFSSLFLPGSGEKVHKEEKRIWMGAGVQWFFMENSDTLGRGREKLPATLRSTRKKPTTSIHRGGGEVIWQKKARYSLLIVQGPSTDCSFPRPAKKGESQGEQPGTPSQGNLPRPSRRFGKKRTSRHNAPRLPVTGGSSHY